MCYTSLYSLFEADAPNVTDFSWTWVFKINSLSVSLAPPPHSALQPRLDGRFKSAAHFENITSIKFGEAAKLPVNNSL